jgi:hypothetical protein
MDEITKQIEAMAEKMEKSSTDPKDGLFAVIKSLGAAGLKAKIATLSDDEKTVLKAALEEMTLKKAVSFDDAYAAKMIQGKVVDTVIQEDIASDDADEKLVKPAAAKMAHQGTPTEGWQGQVIKSVEASEDAMDQLIEKAMEKCKDDKMVMKKLKEKGMDEGKVQGALDKYKAKKEVKKSEDDLEKAKKEKDEAAKKIMAMEEQEHGTKDPKKLVAAEKKEHMKKSDEEIEKAKMNKEEDQLGDAPNLEGGKQVAKKTPAPDIEDNAKANKKNMTKSVSWDDEQRLLKANTGGRNFNFNVEHFITETLKQEPKAPEIKKAEKEDINDILEKGGDRNWDQVRDQRAADASKTSGKLVKSFSDEELAEAMGMTVEEAKKILG